MTSPRGKLRVLHLIYDDLENPWVGGGGAVRAHEIYRRLTDRVDVRVVTGNYPGAANGVRDGVFYERLGVRAPHVLSRATYALQAARLLKRGHYDVAMVDFSSYTPIPIPADRPVGLTVHHLSGPTGAARWGRTGAAGLRMIERALVRRTHWIAATSGHTMALVRAMAAPDTHFRQIGGGVPDRLFDVMRAPGGDLLYFGRIDIYQKGLDTLLDALAILVRGGRSTLKLDVAGRGKDTRAFLDLVRRLGLEANVNFLGAVDDERQEDLLARAAAVVMPSRFEGFGLVAAEVMAAGVPLIASNAGALPEVVDPPNGGVVVPVDDAPALAASIDQLLEDDALRERLSVSAPRTAERFRWSRIADEQFDFLQEIAGLPMRASEAQA